MPSPSVSCSTRATACSCCSCRRSPRVTGEALYLVFRLLDCDDLRAELAGTPRDLAVILSDPFYQAVVRQGYGTIRSEEYRSTRVRNKEVDTTAWLWTPARHDRRLDAAGAPTPGTGGQRITVVNVNGDLTGDVVGGDQLKL